MNSKTKSVPKCPRCNSKKVQARRDGWFECGVCGGLFDDDPNEGGNYSDRSPSARLEREERRKEKLYGNR